MITCPFCHGSGYADGYLICGDCGGRGELHAHYFTNSNNYN